MKKCLFFFILCLAMACEPAGEAYCYGEQIYKAGKLRMCGWVLGEWKDEKLVNRFMIFGGDSLLYNDMHNETARYLFQPGIKGFNLTEIKLETDQERWIHPDKFSRITVRQKNGQPEIIQQEVVASGIIQHVIANFKNTGELYR
jgi:hypothetical protein